MKEKILSEKILARARFLTLKEIDYVDDKGKTRGWESADRIADARAVMIVGRIVPDDEYILVRQFRPPAGKKLIEFPAGLIENGESPETTAARELYEETGYSGSVTHCTRFGYSSPGMSGESIAVVFMEIDGNLFRGREVTAHPEECESIETFRVPAAKFADFIAEREALGDGIDAKIYLFCAAMLR
ncbi:MAG: NUDIX hydrolase [Victivallaceae bacterium]|nr:NUDIX hydrolase [Victivallaceae bacterium]